MSSDHKNTGFQEQRRQRLEWLATYLRQTVPVEGIGYGKVKVILLNKWGLTAEKTDEYLQIVIETYGFELHEGKIVKVREDQRFLV
jgi:hypothetical protein